MSGHRGLGLGRGLGWALLLACAGAACGGDSRGRDGRPNVVVILTDDQRYDTLGCTGSPYAKTPSIDRLAREGALFTRGYVVTSLCCPARATLLTGRYAHETGIHFNTTGAPFLADRAGFPERLQEAGYETAFVGKWHIVNPGAAPQPGFDHWVSFEGQGRYFDETYVVDGRGERIEGFSTDVLTDRAIEFVESPRSRPFCLILSVKNLHGPYLPPERHRRKLLRASFPLPESHGDPDLPAYVEHARTTARNRFFDQDHGGDAEHADYARAYHQLVFSIDENVGRLVAALEAQDLLDRTLVVYTSDGGFLWGEHGMYRKRAAWEPSIRVPLIARWPAAIPAGTRVEALALNVDLAPTILSVAGASAPDDLPGRSLEAVWGGRRPGDWRADFLYVDGWKGPDGPLELAVVGERYKYVRYRRGAVGELLVDRETDPDERRNLAREAGHAQRLEAMRGRMVELLADTRSPAGWMAAVATGGEGD